MKSAPPPVTRIEDAPLSCNVAWTARLLGRSVSDINRDLALGIMQPAPMPDVQSVLHPRKRLRRKWSRFAIEAWLRGGYLEFVQQATPQKKAPGRSYFNSARRKEQGSGQRLSVSA